jgi:pyruvate-formate lyase-activating enzyme
MIAISNIEHNILYDAPFIGARVSGIICNFNCKNCINDDLKNKSYTYMYSHDIINEVKNNMLNEGIIFGGLEWMHQLHDLKILVNKAFKNKLKIMIYSGSDNPEGLIKLFGMYEGLYIKYGRYIENSEYIIDYGIKLASSNQKIIKIGE